MELFLKILINDLKLIFRDKSLLMMFIVPLAIVFMCRYGIPQLAVVVPGLPEYYWIIVAAFTSVTASTPSFLFGFVLLDERDENVHILLRILPVPENYILKIRVLFMVFLGFLFSLVILVFNNLIHLSVIHTLEVSFLFALIPPVLTFAIVAFSKNKIEAATMYKGLSILLFLPVAAFFVGDYWKFAFGIIPFFWTMNAINAVGNNVGFMPNFILSVISHSIIILFLYQIYRKRAV